MRSGRKLILIAAGTIAFCAGSGIVRAQHTYDILVQQVSGQLVTAGCCDGAGKWQTTKKTFESEFPDDPSNPTPTDWATTNPGYGSYAAANASIPAGTQALPGSTDIFWDFMPMINNGVAQNLFYWNGKRPDGQYGTSPSDVNFGPPPLPSYTLSEYDKNGAKFSTNGTNSIVAGGDIGTTGSDGSLHRHWSFFLEDNDGNSSTSPADGVYLIADRYRMNGMLNSDPVFILFDTSNPAVPATILDSAAVPWVAQHVNMLTGVSGDFNRNGTPDAADYVMWRKTLGQTGSTQMADWNYNNQVDNGDYTVWRSHFGTPLPTNSPDLGSAAVPEPSSVWLFCLGCALALGWNLHRRRTEWRLAT